MKMAAFHWLRNIHIVCPKHSSPFLLHTTTDEPKKAEIFCRLSIRSFTDFSCPSRLNRPPAAQRPMGRGGVSYSADVDCPTEGTPLRSAARARQGRYSELLSIFYVLSVPSPHFPTLGRLGWVSTCTQWCKFMSKHLKFPLESRADGEGKLARRRNIKSASFHARSNSEIYTTE